MRFMEMQMVAFIRKQSVKYAATRGTSLDYTEPFIFRFMLG